MVPYRHVWIQRRKARFALSMLATVEVLMLLEMTKLKFLLRTNALYSKQMPCTLKISSRTLRLNIDAELTSVR